MPTLVARVLFPAILLLVACSVSYAEGSGKQQGKASSSAGGKTSSHVEAPLQGATVSLNPRRTVEIGFRSADLSDRRPRNAQQEETVVAAIASAQVPAAATGRPVSVGLEGGSAGGGTGFQTIEAIPTENRPSHVNVSKKLSIAIRNSDIAGAVELLTREDDVHELARGLKFDGSERQQLLKKSSSRMPDGDVITMKSIAKAVLDTRDARKFAMVMVLSTMNERQEDLERKLVQVLRDRELMHAILFADPAKQFIPDEGKVLSTSPKIRQSEKDGGNQFLTNGLGRRRLACDGCSPQNSFVCVHCWAKDVCESFSWCS